MIRTFQDTSRFQDTPRETSRAATSSRPTAAAPMVATLRAMGGALREGLAAARQYEQLRSSGVPHERAVREALGIGLIPSQAPRERANPLHFAGRA
jgi:hypothetical protein